MDKNTIHCKLFLDKRKNGVVQPNGSVGTQNHSDYYINIPIKRTIKKFDDYINVEKDPLRVKINRQQINPYFIELAFFETIKSFESTGAIHDNIEEKSKTFNIKINK